MDIALEEEYYDRYLVEMFFDQLKDYPIYSFSDKIQWSLIESLKRGHSGIAEFMDARLMKSAHYSQMKWKKNQLNRNRAHVIPTADKDAEEIHVAIADVSPLQVCQDILLKVFEEDKPGKISRDISTRLFDIPELHIGNSMFSRAFINELANLEDTEIMKSLAVQSIVEQRWAKTQPYMVAVRDFPYICYFTLFQIWAIYFVP